MNITRLPFNRTQTIREQNTTSTLFFSCDLDLDLDPMTLMYELGLDVLKIHLHIKNKLSRSRLKAFKSCNTSH